MRKMYLISPPNHSSETHRHFTNTQHNPDTETHHFNLTNLQPNPHTHRSVFMASSYRPLSTITKGIKFTLLRA